MRQTGTEWVAPGQGATVGALADALGADVPANPNRRTNLLLTGRALEPLDRVRIREVLACGGPRPEPGR